MEQIIARAIPRIKMDCTCENCNKGERIAELVEKGMQNWTEIDFIEMHYLSKVITSKTPVTNRVIYGLLKEIVS